MQFLITHHVSTVQKIIRNLESSIVESINSAEELLEIKVKSLKGEDIFTEIERALARETDDIVMKPIQRLEFTSSLVEELFKKELKEQTIDLMRDETNIFVVGFEQMKSLITKQIDEINRVTATKVVKLGDKWKIEAVKCFGITETLSKTFSAVVFRLQEETSSVYLKGRDVTINKAEKEVHKLLSDLFNEKLLFDPLTLKLLISKETSELFNEILQKEHLPVVWTVDSTHLYFFSKTKIDTDTLKAIVYENFLTAGFSKSPYHGKQFCDSYAFIEITNKQNNKLLFLETTKSGVNIAGTKNLIFNLLHQEKLFYNDVGNAKEIQVDTLSLEVASIKDEKMKIDREKRELEVKLNDETQKRKNTNDQYQLLERKCKEGEEKLKRITLEKELLLRESRDKEANFITQLEELKKMNDKRKKNPRASSDTKSRPMQGQILQQRPTQPSGCQQPDFLNPKDEGKVKENVSDIFYRHAVYEENIQLTRSELRFLQEQYQTEIRSLQQQCAKDHVALNIDNILVFIRGNSNGVKDAKKKIDGIVRSIYKKKYTLKKAGIVRHMTSNQGQTIISQVEKRNKVVVQLQTGEDSDDEENTGQAQPISPRITYKETARCTIPSGQTIITVVGDITELDVDVIVNAANKELQHVGGLAKVIVDKGGKSIQKECDDYVRSKSRARKLYEGEIFCSSPGNLNCKMIAHAVGPVWQNGRQSEDEYLSECIQASLEKTEDKKYRSIAIPALCTGVFGYPPNKATKVILEAIRDYLRENGATSPVRQIYLCDVKEDIVDHFVSALERYFDKANIKKQVGNPGFVRRPPLRFLPDQGVSGGWQQRALADNRQGSVDIGNLTLKVYQGDLTEASVEVIVNGTNRELDLTRGGVSQAILKKGGRELSQLLSVPAAKKEMKREGVATTTAGSNFSCDFIIHINMEDSHMDLKAKFETVLEKVDELNKTSVALPALGAGISFSIDKVAENLFEALVSFHRKTTDISEVQVVIYEKDKLSQFLAAMQNCLQSQSYQSQGLISKVKGIFGYGEKKSVSTKQWKVSKMPSSVLNLVVYAKKQIDADSALRSLEESLINDYKEKLIEDTVIKELTKEQEAKILKLEETCEVEIEFNKRIGRIKFRGLIENLSEAMDEVHKNLRDVERQRQKQQHAKLVADMVQWYFISVEDTGQKLEEYPAEVNLILEQALKNNESQAIYFDKSGNRYIVDFNNYEAFPEDDPFDYVAVLRKSKMTDYAFEMPPNWASMDQNENIKIVTLQPADKEYQDVVQDFQMNMAGNYKSIIKMEKIQNKTLQQQYEAKKLSMHSTNATGTNYERKLWHGTTMEAVDSINTFGFNRSYCGKNAVAFGNGVYFAVNPTYSAQAHYARPDPNGNKRMYMCKVLVGDFAKGQGGMKVPPPKPGAAGGHILYDSVVDNPQNPGIFVIFHDSQAYPEYLIVFK
ncbi:protein mono-ADP-ribosyltransferase PARP14-like isoform X2 [Mytilus californianus]|uniref:protein mono-ADP-ribosyltransferase PARP14-like isoform X2 n=1 Tax=Mytilus californianus TaxID=6549 RepID=UPI00224838D5|nr:protein mono-ADP-ribosyltransferase PARP14-like isoform X2 [Mytilus californianus]